MRTRPFSKKEPAAAGGACWASAFLAAAALAVAAAPVFRSLRLNRSTMASSLRASRLYIHAPGKRSKIDVAPAHHTANLLAYELLSVFLGGRERCRPGSFRQVMCVAQRG